MHRRVSPDICFVQVRQSAFGILPCGVLDEDCSGDYFKVGAGS